nr:hypothetical protein [Tanacetum cinerariifolium]
ILEDKIICDLDKTPDLSQRSPQNCPKCGHPVDGHYCQGCALLRKKFKEDLFTSCIEHGILLDSFEPSNDNPNVANAPREPFVVNQDPGKNSSQSLPQINHHCCYGCGDPLEADLVHDSPNVFDPPPQLPFYLYAFYGNDARYGHYCTPQVSFIYPEPCYNQDFNFSHDFQQQDLCCENCRVTHEAYQCQPKNEDYYHEQNSCYDHNSFGFDQFQPQHYTVNHPIFNTQNDLFDSQNKLMEQLTSICDMIPACYDDDDADYAFAITPNEPGNSLNMGDEHLDIIPATESDEFIKSSIENLVPNPSESEGKNECDMPVCEAFTTFSNILFDAEYDLYSSDDQSFFDEDFPKEIYSNPLFDEEIISMKTDQHHFNSESDLIESMLNHDSSIISSSKIDSLFDEFFGELTLLKSIPPGIDETDCDPEEETHFIKRLLYDNSSPRPPKEFISENSDAAIESFSSSPIPVEDSDSLMEEINLSFTSAYPMSPGIEDDDYDSERDILILEELLSNDSFSLPKNESFHFDIPSFSRPPAKPPDGNTRILNVKMMGDISKQKVPMPRLMITLVPNQEKSPDLLSHQGLEAIRHSAECPMMIMERTLLSWMFHFSISIPLDQFKYGGIGSSSTTYNKRFYSRKCEDSCQRILYSSLHFLSFNRESCILEDKIICDLDKTPDLSQRSPQNCPKCGHPVDGHYCQGCALLRKKFKEDLFTSCIEHGILQDSFEPSNDNPNVANAPREPFVVNQDPGKNSSQSLPQINHHCCYGCGDPLEGIFCHQCTCKFCGNGAHYGYKCRPKVLIIPDPEPFNNQTIKDLPPTV